ncbi:MAG: DNA gyrase inhibitor YacG [Comamonadaceae bacterium]|nr:DNA gyrase inhibitor YacG [Comamonadaceae bacterium]RRD56849.1 DNA gyrase inhibitor YacG [Comamonadaceae bacterium OH2545_COT-014]
MSAPRPPAPSPAPARQVRCPACGGPSLYAPENAFRPFCSQRCKLHDLGAWANESFRMEVQEDDAGNPPSAGTDG